MERSAFALYMAVLVIGPLLFGAIHTYAYTFMSLGVLAATLLLIVKNVGRTAGSGRWTFQCPRTGLYVFFFMMTAFLVFQTIPLPDSMTSILSPEAHQIAEAAIPAPLVVDGAAGSGFRSALAPYIYPVRMSIMRFLVYGLFFFGFAQVLNSRRRIELAVVLLLLTGSFTALYGILQTYSADPHIWWVRSGPSRQAVNGTYINRNHFAGFMEMGVLMAAAFSGAIALGVKKRLPVPGIGLRGRIGAFLSGEQERSKRVLVLLAGIVMGLGLIFSGSRAGMASAAAGLLCLGLFFVFKRKNRRKGALVLFLFTATAGYALYMGVDYPLSRFENLEPSFEARYRYARTTFELFRDYPIFGVGVGNFQYAYPVYQAPQDQGILVEHAHNDWVQFLAEAGLVGFGIMLLGAGWIAFVLMRAYRRRQEPFAVSLGAVPFAVMAAIGLHSIYDFNLHMPANFLIFTAVLAIGFSALHLEREPMGALGGLPFRVLPLRGSGALALLLGLGLVLWTGLWSVRHFVAEAHCNTVPNSTLNRDMDPPAGDIQTAMAWDPWNAGYPYRLALKFMLPNPEAAEAAAPGAQVLGASGIAPLFLQGTAEAIIPPLERSLALNPFEGERHLLLGWAYASLWDRPNYRERWLPAADLAMQRAALFTQDSEAGVHAEMGNFWVLRSKTLHPADPEHAAARASAAAHYSRALDMSSEKARNSMREKISAYVWLFYPDEQLVGQLVKTPEPEVIQ
ncbi:O-antigen ligase family protein [Desulfatiglans anilini]|uniref:O-antigen ligase family protein n=1 Tax=Desulfatiglans anilini TaxID=90728 RepID=UPI0004098910|nr:O-antigen ligase family protein [Desulfatiglans anilini]